MRAGVETTGLTAAVENREAVWVGVGEKESYHEQATSAGIDAPGITHLRHMGPVISRSWLHTYAQHYTITQHAATGPHNDSVAAWHRTRIP